MYSYRDPGDCEIHITIFSNDGGQEMTEIYHNDRPSTYELGTSVIFHRRLAIGDIAIIEGKAVLNSATSPPPQPSTPSGTTMTSPRMTAGAARQSANPNGKFRSGTHSSTTGTIPTTLEAPKMSRAVGLISLSAPWTSLCSTAVTIG